MTRRRRAVPRWFVHFSLVLLAGVALSWSWPQRLGRPAQSPPSASPPAGAADAPADGQRRIRARKRIRRRRQLLGHGRAARYGLWVLVPPVLTIGFAIAFRQVIAAMVLGILAASLMLVPCVQTASLPSSAVGWLDLVVNTYLIGGLRLAVETYLISAISDLEHEKIILFTLIISAMVGMVTVCGGVEAVVRTFAPYASSRRSGQIATWMGGVLVFFDDYSSCMIVGPTMRPICDRIGISRAKLAYIVDSTAAPIASLALIGTWVGTEIGYIQQGLDSLTASGTMPAFLASTSGYGAFIQSLPYRFYVILALVMVVLVALLNRDFGPMLRAESRARRG